MSGRKEVVLAFDYGTRRIGVAVGQTTTGSASALGAVAVHGRPDWGALEQRIRDWAPARLLVGLPYNMDGTDTLLTATCRDFADELARRSALPVEFVDERLTSATATAELRDARRSGARARRVRREDIDAHAARLMLETWLRESAPSPKEPSLTTDTGSELQRDPKGRLRHLITLDGLTRDELAHLLDLAQFYVRSPGDLPARDQSLAGRTVANLFFEPSTRTRVSFELAATRLGADVVNLDLHSSSRVKGETVLDTIYTLQAMQVDVFVMRDAEPGLPAWVAGHVASHVSVLNAGEAHVSHPTQGLLDVLTIRQRKGDLGQLRVAIVGDVSHSRVARSTGRALLTLGVGELRLVSPASLMPGRAELEGATRFTSLAEGLRDADVVMALRIQRERMTEADALDPEAFYREWGISAENLRVARPDAIVLHPGPMNRGVEITSEVADGPQSVIRQQVTNGVAVRMAVLATIVRNVQERILDAGRSAG